MLEFLISQGSSDADLRNCSLEKLRWLYHLATGRRLKDRAAEELTHMRAVITAVSALFDKKWAAQYNARERTLLNLIEGDAKQDAAANRAALEAQLMKLGARRKQN